MTGMNEFLALFGDITLANFIQFCLACGFMVVLFMKGKKYLTEKIRVENDREEKTNKLFNRIETYDTDIAQLKRTQETMRGDIEELNAMHQQTYAFLTEMKDTMDKRDRNKTRDRLLQYYRHYTSLESNPTQSWNRMEADSFWETLADYDEAHGEKDGYIHTVVQPAMLKLKIIEI